MDLHQIDQIIAAAKSLRGHLVRRQRLIDNAPDHTQVTRKRFQAHGVAVTWVGMDIDKAEFALHTAVVRAAVCRPYEDDHYGDTTHRPSAFHTYDFKRPHPLKGSQS